MKITVGEGDDAKVLEDVFEFVLAGTMADKAGIPVPIRHIFRAMEKDGSTRDSECRLIGKLAEVKERLRDGIPRN